MASRMIKEERAARNERLRRSDEARKHLTHEISSLGDSLDRDLRDRVTNIHTNARSLDSQGAQLKTKTAGLSKSTRQWSGIAEGARGRLKEVGDVQNWAEMIERDLLLLEETLRIVNDDEHLTSSASHSNARR